MLFGHNTNVQAGDTTYNVQTEDRGTATALIDTTVYFRGRVLHRRTNNYFDLLPLHPGREQALKVRLELQHRAVVAEVRKGELHLALPRLEIAAASSAPAPPAVTGVLSLQLFNASTGLTRAPA